MSEFVGLSGAESSVNQVNRVEEETVKMCTVRSNPRLFEVKGGDR